MAERSIERFRKRPQVQVTLEWAGTPEDVQKLKALLKELGRRYGLRCVGLRELPPEPTSKTVTHFSQKG
jgi:hypothetical protein